MDRIDRIERIVIVRNDIDKWTVEVSTAHGQSGGMDDATGEEVVLWLREITASDYVPPSWYDGIENAKFEYEYSRLSEEFAKDNPDAEVTNYMKYFEEKRKAENDKARARRQCNAVHLPENYQSKLEELGL